MLIQFEISVVASTRALQNDDLSDKLKDYESVAKIHQSMTPDIKALESEIRRLKNALEAMEKAKKADLAQCKMRYEHRITAINDEIQTIQNQLSRYKRERDTYKHMLEGAQKTIGELKSARGRTHSNASSAKSDEVRPSISMFTACYASHMRLVSYSRT